MHSLPFKLEPILAENSFWFSLRESSFAGLAIVIILAVLSCFSWAVMFTKFRMVKRVRKQSEQFTEAYRDCSNPLGLYGEGTHLRHTPLYMLYQDGASEMAYQLTGSSLADDSLVSRVGASERVKPTQMSAVNHCMERALGESIIKLEAQMSILATAVSGAPFLGLLGTVWGVMDVFTGVAASEAAASLKLMAPGVSTALLTTVVGLLVAIPAMFGYNFLVNAIRQIIAEMETFSAELKSDFERAFLDHGRGGRVDVEQAKPRSMGRRASTLQRRTIREQIRQEEPLPNDTEHSAFEQLARNTDEWEEAPEPSPGVRLENDTRRSHHLRDTSDLLDEEEENSEIRNSRARRVARRRARHSHLGSSERNLDDSFLES